MRERVLVLLVKGRCRRPMDPTTHQQDRVFRVAGNAL